MRGSPGLRCRVDPLDQLDDEAGRRILQQRGAQLPTVPASSPGSRTAGRPVGRAAGSVVSGVRPMTSRVVASGAVEVVAVHGEVRQPRVATGEELDLRAVRIAADELARPPPPATSTSTGSLQTSMPAATSRACMRPRMSGVVTQRRLNPMTVASVTGRPAGRGTFHSRRSSIGAVDATSLAIIHASHCTSQAERDARLRIGRGGAHPRVEPHEVPVERVGDRSRSEQFTLTWKMRVAVIGTNRDPRAGDAGPERPRRAGGAGPDERARPAGEAGASPAVPPLHRLVGQSHQMCEAHGLRLASCVSAPGRPLLIGRTAHAGRGSDLRFAACCASRTPSASAS